MEGRKEDAVYTTAWGEVRDTEVGVAAQTIDYPVTHFRYRVPYKQTRYGNCPIIILTRTKKINLLVDSSEANKEKAS
jgi:hypothetical protein